ncbi:MAG TPA: dihydrofolate reductase family protein [Solirubrobacteraceae bacterium]
MASLTLKMSVSLDGYVASLDGSTDWLGAGRSDDSTSWVLETVSNAGAHLIGAAAYAQWASYWPTASGRFAKAMNEIPKVVLSNSLTSADWGETQIATGLLVACGELCGRLPLPIPPHLKQQSSRGQSSVARCQSLGSR